MSCIFGTIPATSISMTIVIRGINRSHLIVFNSINRLKRIKKTARPASLWKTGIDSICYHNQASSIMRGENVTISRIRY